ncbi:hypothetical protein Dimus_035658 [Dionaea muscipula]
MKKSRVTIKAMFANMDTDQSGTITYEELNEQFASLHEEVCGMLFLTRINFRGHGKVVDGREIMVQFAKYGPNAERILCF